MSLQGKHTKEWFERANAVLVNGVSSQFRYWGDDDTIVIDHGEGGYLVDMDGKRYLDYQLGFGPIILGHGDPAVSEAVAEAAREGASFAMTQRREVDAAEKVLTALAWPERIRFTNTGTEATMHAIRLARGVTGRDIVLKFEGQYHGVHDYVMYSTASAAYGSLGSRMRPIPVQSSSGIPDEIRTFIRTLPYNDLDAVHALFRGEGHRIAAVIVEPTLGNTFGLLPVAGFLEGLREVTGEYGAALIFDEVKTGFRIAVGGAAEHFGVTPDIGTYAKAMGNGFPVAAIATTGRFVEGWRQGGIAQAGTYSGNGVAAAAAGATVDRLKTGEPLAQVEKVGRDLMEGLEKILADRGVAGKVVGHPSMFSIYLGEGEPTDFRDTAKHDEDLYERLTMRMIEKGVMPCPDAKEPWFVCAAHTDDDVATTLQVFEESLGETVDDQ
ncbi:MAG: aminotransferase class III-fold pyridoxal phosphate-dependent enzyme [Actinobacteria bacterium]|nr:MAG: aminotransferase class III-fold pyridoxal phosphate-dependent enzyme [Actinomycetota bacterium]